MLNRFDMFNARKIQEFVMFIFRLFLRYPREAFYPLIYECNISMPWTLCGSGRKSHLVTRIVDRRSAFCEVKFKVF